MAAVVGSEMPASFPPEALRAQAVAARTFALCKKLEALGAGRELAHRRHGPRPGLRGRPAPTRARGRRPRPPRRGAGARPRAGRGLLPLRRAAAAPSAAPTRWGATCPTSRRWPATAAAARPARAGRCGSRPPTWRRAPGSLARCARRGWWPAPPRGGRRGWSSPRARAAGPAASRWTAVDLRQRLGFARLPSLAVRGAGGRRRGGLRIRAGHGPRRRALPVGRGRRGAGGGGPPRHPRPLLPRLRDRADVLRFTEGHVSAALRLRLRRCPRSSSPRRRSPRATPRACWCWPAATPRRATPLRATCRPSSGRATSWS